MQIAKASRVDTQYRKAITGKVMLLLVAILTGYWFAAALTALNAVGLNLAQVSGLINAASAWIWLAGLAVALASLLVCCLGSLLDSIGLARHGQTLFVLAHSPQSSAPLWQNWADIRPPLSSE